MPYRTVLYQYIPVSFMRLYGVPRRRYDPTSGRAALHAVSYSIGDTSTLSLIDDEKTEGMITRVFVAFVTSPPPHHHSITPRRRPPPSDGPAVCAHVGVGYSCGIDYAAQLRKGLSRPGTNRFDRARRVLGQVHVVCGNDHLAGRLSILPIRSILYPA